MQFFFLDCGVFVNSRCWFLEILAISLPTRSNVIVIYYQISLTVLVHRLVQTPVYLASLSSEVSYLEFISIWNDTSLQYPKPVLIGTCNQVSWVKVYVIWVRSPVSSYLFICLSYRIYYSFFDFLHTTSFRKEGLYHFKIPSEFIPYMIKWVKQ